MRRIAEFVQNGSGWSISRVDKIVLSMAVYNPTGGSSFIRTPKNLINKKAIINVQNDDNKCFVWAVLSALHPQPRDTERLSKYKPFEKELVIEGLEFPMKVCDIKKFEKINGTISINVFANDEKTGVYPVYDCSEKPITSHKLAAANGRERESLDANKRLEQAVVPSRPAQWAEALL